MAVNLVDPYYNQIIYHYNYLTSKFADQETDDNNNA
jgi:hypothetical protein